MSERFITIPKWEDLQHYKTADRPAWIKTYAKLLHDDRYLNLSGHQRAVLHGLWLAYASSGCRLPLDTRSLSARLQLRVSSATLTSLNDAGFIAICSREGLEQRREEKNREEVTTTTPPTAVNFDGLQLLGSYIQGDAA
jgi:hypothetical protein